MLDPACLVIGGPNGAGKTTAFLGMTVKGTFVNVDDLARAMSSARPAGSNAIEAGRLAIQLVRGFIVERRDFVLETTLSSRHSLRVMAEAKRCGFRVGLLFVMLRDPELNIVRVRARVAQGGHDIPDHVVRRRYAAALDQLARAIPHADRIEIRDNSGAVSETLIEIDDGTVVRDGLDLGDNYHSRIAAAVSAGLGVGTGTLFPR